MSFIYDNPWLVNDLLKSALDFEKKFLKKGQADPQEVARQNAVALQSHIKSMQDQLNPPAKDPNASAEISTDSDKEVALKMPSLENLGTFVEFVATNAITVDGKRIAYMANEPVTDPSYQLYKLEGSAGLLELAQRNETVKLGWRVNKDLLIKYIQSLQAILSKKPNPALGAPLQSIIQEANEQLGANVAEYQEPGKMLNPNDIVDGFVNRAMNINAPYTGLKEFAQAKDTAGAGVSLTYGDISSKESLTAWLNNMKYVGADGKPYTPTDPGADPCGAIHILYLRASYLAKSANKARPNFGELSAAYLKNIETFGSQFDFNGQACSVSRPTAGGQAAQQGQSGQQTSSASLFQEIAGLQPFNSQNIDFQRILKFVNKYVALANNPAMNNLANQINTSMGMANQILSAPESPIILTNMSVQGFKLLCKNPNQAVKLANILYTIISTTGSMYQSFLDSYEKAFGETYQQALEQMKQQILGGGSPYASNITILRTMMAEVPKA